MQKICGIEASYIPDMLIQCPVIALIASDSCNDQDIVLAMVYKYNLLDSQFGLAKYNAIIKPFIKNLCCVYRSYN